MIRNTNCKQARDAMCSPEIDVKLNKERNKISDELNHGIKQEINHYQNQSEKCFLIKKKKWKHFMFKQKLS